MTTTSSDSPRETVAALRLALTKAREWIDYFESQCNEPEQRALALAVIDTALASPPASEVEVVWSDGEYAAHSTYATLGSGSQHAHLFAGIQLESDVPYGVFMASVSIGGVHARAGLLPDMEAAKLRAVELWRAVRGLVR